MSAPRGRLRGQAAGGASAAAAAAAAAAALDDLLEGGRPRAGMDRRYAKAATALDTPSVACVSGERERSKEVYVQVPHRVHRQSGDSFMGELKVAGRARLLPLDIRPTI